MKLKPHETWSIIDSSKLTEYMRCPRRYFWRYLLAWRPSGKSQDLVFGSAWHAALEHLLKVKRQTGHYPEDVTEAYEHFLSVYREEFDESTDMDYHPKSPGNALSALQQYVSLYKGDAFEVVHTEAGGAVPLTVDMRHVLHFKMDDIVRGPDGLYYLQDHKTTKRMDRRWHMQWALSTQMSAYLFALHILYPGQPTYVAEVNGVQFLKTRLEFCRVPVRKTEEDIRCWLDETAAWMDRLDYDMERLQDANPDSPSMGCFERNTCACGDFYGCPYHDLCCNWANPLKELGRGIQPGYVVERWDPRKEAEKAEFQVNTKESGDA